MYLNADLISWTGAAEWALVRGTGSSKHEANSYYEFVTRLSIRTLRLVDVPEFTSVFHALIQITSTWSLGHSCLFPAIVHFVAIIFYVISKSISVMCPSRAWKFVEAEPVLTRYYHDRISQLINLGRCSERIQYNWSKNFPTQCIFVSASGCYCIYTNSPMYVPYWVSGQQIDLALIWQFRFGRSLVYRFLSNRHKKGNTGEQLSVHSFIFL